MWQTRQVEDTAASSRTGRGTTGATHMTTPEEDFDGDGVVCLRQVFEPHWIETLARGVERNLAEPSPLAKRYTCLLYTSGPDTRAPLQGDHPSH